MKRPPWKLVQIIMPIIRETGLSVCVICTFGVVILWPMCEKLQLSSLPYRRCFYHYYYYDDDDDYYYC